MQSLEYYHENGYIENAPSVVETPHDIKLLYRWVYQARNET